MKPATDVAEDCKALVQRGHDLCSERYTAARRAESAERFSARPSRVVAYPGTESVRPFGGETPWSMLWKDRSPGRLCHLAMLLTYRLGHGANRRRCKGAGRPR
jgi:hypothetical protein